MPVKICPKCQMKHGPRRLICECGHDFQVRRKNKKSDKAPHALYPEPGAWLADKMKGMPPVFPPDPLPSGAVTIVFIKEQVSYEGLGYCVYDLIPADRITDPQLRKMWEKTRAAMQEIVGYLENG